MKHIAQYVQAVTGFVRKEAILCIAFLLALLSSFVIKPDKEYLSYIDFRVLALLFCLMTVMAGLQLLGIFDRIAHVMLRNARSYRQLSVVLVFLCFFAAMLVTNDVALITFVPFTILLFEMAGIRERLIPVIVLQTVAANLGSMMTPVGNPQNLYLYAVSGMSFIQFLCVMLPLTCVSGVLLLICCLVQKNSSLDIKLGINRVDAAKAEHRDKKKSTLFLGALFLLSLLTVARVLPFGIPLSVTIAGTFLVKKEILAKVDYCLLFTFVCFFIFIGNMGRMEQVRRMLEALLEGRELMIAFVSSQFISNVPAAILLSGFTDNWVALLQGVNIGGLGTVIASLASLISYKFYAGSREARKGSYLLKFTAVNAAFAAVLLVMAV